MKKKKMALALSDMMKDGTRHLKGVDEAVMQNVEAVKALSQITRTSLGPNGMKKMIVNQHQKLFVTSDAATILKELDVIHPAAKLVVMAAQQQEHEMGDGTNFVVVLAGELLQNAAMLISKGLHPSDVILGYETAGKAVAAEIENLSVHEITELANVERVAACLRTALASKQFGYEATLAALVAQACVYVLPRNPAHFDVDRVRVAKVLGGGALDTRVVKGFVVTRTPEGSVHHLKNAKVAVFGAGIDLPKTETKDTLLVETAEQLLEYAKTEEKQMDKIVQEIVASGANCIISGGAISEMALHFLERAKVMVIKVPSKFELRRVCQTTSATPLVRLGAPTAEELGHCDAIGVEEIGSTKVIVFTQDNEKSGIATIVVRSPTQNALDDFERTIDDGVNLFKAMTRNGRFVAGAGAADMELATRISAIGDTTVGLQQYAVKKYAEAFEVIPRTLAENAGLNATDTLSALYSAHKQAAAGKPSSVGINIENGECEDAVALGVLDHLATKACAIRLATDAAVSVLRIDQIIMSKRAGGPKPPEMGARDEE